MENLQLVLLITGLRAEHDFPVQLSEDSFYYNGSITNCPFSRRPADKELIGVHVLYEKQYCAHLTDFFKMLIECYAKLAYYTEITDS